MDHNNLLQKLLVCDNTMDNVVGDKPQGWRFQFVETLM
jgi:hypothetical protein